MENIITDTVDTNTTLVDELLQENNQDSTHQEIPENSRTILINEFTSRFSSAIWYNKIQEAEVTLAGVGGIGSYVGFLLSRLNIAKLIVYDPDRVDASNMSGQFYNFSHIGEHKVNALAGLIQNFSHFWKYYMLALPFTRNTGLSGKIMICGFDNMSARKEFFESWENYISRYIPTTQKKECLFIDGRLAAEEFQVLCIKGDDTYNINRYKQEFLFDDEEADPTICSYKQTSFMANMIASVMINLFVNFIANQCDPLIDRDLPFFTKYNAETMFFKTEM